MRRGAGLVAVALTLSGCAYYNAMWSAERAAGEARRLEARGREAEARTRWALAAVKAESVVTHHPRSRWADDALVLQGEALARAGTCATAAAPIAKALANVTDEALRERAALAAADCALLTGQPAEAERALAEALASNDAGRRSRAEYLAGRASVSRSDYDGAVAHFRRSREPAALPARARALLAAGQPEAAGAILDTLTAENRFNRDDWTQLLDGLASAGGGAAASTALDRLLARARVPTADGVALLIADGDRRLVRGDLDGAAGRYRQAAAMPAGDDGVARVRGQRVLAARAATRDDLGPVVAELTHIVGAGAADARTLRDLVSRVAAIPESPGAGFRLAELARDSLGAPRLAGQLFLDLATSDTGSIFAPKALVAALPLLPERHDSIIDVLDRVYTESPYTRALRGDASPAFAAAEDSLARELGVEIARGTPVGAARSRPGDVLTGPRGPWLDEAPARGASPAARARPRVDERGRRVPVERPTERPSERPDRL